MHNVSCYYTCTLFNSDKDSSLLKSKLHYMSRPTLHVHTLTYIVGVIDELINTKMFILTKINEIMCCLLYLQCYGMCHGNTSYYEKLQLH